MSEESRPTVIDDIEEARRELLSRSGLQALFYPRCPACLGPLIQKMASSRLLCARCGREYALREVGGREGDRS